MDVHASLSIGVVAGDIIGDGGWGGFVGLLEGHLARDLGVSSEDGNCGESVSMIGSIRIGWVSCVRVAQGERVTQAS